LVIAASSAAVHTGHAQTTAQPKAKAKADECLSRPGATAPKGSHWFYRIERPSNRRCWYLGPAGQKVRPETAERTAATRRAVPMPAPAPSELRPDEQTRAETPAATATTGARNGAPEDWSPVAATNFSAAWPAGTSADASGRITTTAAVNNEADGAAAEPPAEAPAEDMPLVWPARPATDGAAAQPSDAMPGVAQLLIFLAATVAFVAIAVRLVLKLFSAPRVRPARREPVRAAEPVIRRRAPERAAPEPTIEDMSEPAIARLREIAKRWEAPGRVPRQPRLAAYELEPDYEVKTELRRRRAVA
jgi:hypothetical protein